MAANPLRGTDHGREASRWLDDHGQKGRAANVRRVCDAHSAQEREIAKLRAEIARLRAASTPTARARARAEFLRSPLMLEFMAEILRLEETQQVYDEHGGGASIHVADGPALIDLLYRVAASLA